MVKSTERQSYQFYPSPPPSPPFKEIFGKEANGGQKTEEKAQTVAIEILSSPSDEEIGEVVTKQFKNGNFYNGTVKKGLMHGKGIMLFFNGDSYEGEWTHGKMEGIGIAKYDKIGDSYEGGWYNNQRHGHGRYHHRSGLIFEGRYVENQKQGVFIVTGPFGSSCEMTFENDKLVKDSVKMLYINVPSQSPPKLIHTVQTKMDSFFLTKS